DPEDGGRQVPQDCAPRAVRGRADARRAMIKTIWLDNPPVNAVSADVLEHLWSELDDVGDARVVVLRGAGERAFSAGADISGFGSLGATDRPAGIAPLADRIEALEVPVVAAIHGYCLGGGL